MRSKTPSIEDVATLANFRPRRGEESFYSLHWSSMEWNFAEYHIAQVARLGSQNAAMKEWYKKRAKYLVIFINVEQRVAQCMDRGHGLELEAARFCRSFLSRRNLW